MPRQHEAPATIEPVAPGENLPLAAGPRSQSRGGGAGGHGGRGSRSGGGSRGARRDLPILAVFHGGGGGWPPPSGPPRAPLPERRDGRDRAALPLRRPLEREAGPAAAGTRFHPRPPSQRGPPGAAPPRAGREPALQAATPTGPLPPRPSQGRRAPRRMRARARAGQTDWRASPRRLKVPRGRRRDTIGTRLPGGPTGPSASGFSSPGLENAVKKKIALGANGNNLQNALLFMKVEISPPSNILNLLPEYRKMRHTSNTYIISLTVS